MAQLYESECYCTNTRRSSGFLTEYYDKQLEESGMSIAQYYLLINLYRMGPMNITHWAEQVGLERSTMVRNVRTLEKNQYIELAEGYGKVYKLSSHGEESLMKAQQRWNIAQSKIEAYLGKEDADAFLRISRKIQNADMGQLLQ